MLAVRFKQTCPSTTYNERGSYVQCTIFSDRYNVHRALWTHGFQTYTNASRILMPTLLYSGPYRFFFYSIDCKEPPHVHVERDDKVMKVWLTPIQLQNAGGFKRNEINRILQLIDDHLDEL